MPKATPTTTTVAINPLTVNRTPRSLIARASRGCLDLAWPRLEHCGDVHGKPRQQHGRRRFPAAVRACFFINLAV